MTVESVDRNLVCEWFDGDLKLVCKRAVQEITLRPGIQ